MTLVGPDHEPGEGFAKRASVKARPPGATFCSKSSNKIKIGWSASRPAIVFTLSTSSTWGSVRISAAVWRSGCPATPSARLAVTCWMRLSGFQAPTWVTVSQPSPGQPGLDPTGDNGLADPPDPRDPGQRDAGPGTEPVERPGVRASANQPRAP